jgi:hypothetical protein
MIKNPHRWIVTFIWGFIWFPFEVIHNIKVYGWYGFCTPKSDRGKPWQHWSRIAVLQGAKALFLALTRDWNETQQYCHVIYFNLFYPLQTGRCVGGFHFILAGRMEGWKHNIKSTWIEKIGRFLSKQNIVTV